MTDGEVREVNQKRGVMLTGRAARDGARRPVAANWFLRALVVRCGRFDLARYTSNYVQACLFNRNHKKQDKTLTTEWSNESGISHFIASGNQILCASSRQTLASQSDNRYFLKINSTG